MAKIPNFASKEKIHWKFIVPMASWEGGAYERLCGMAKNAFKKAIGPKILPLDDMNTLIAEVEGILNSCPLVPMDDNPDSVRAIRPLDFLRENGQPGLPPIDELEDEEWNPPDIKIKWSKCPNVPKFASRAQ